MMGSGDKAEEGSTKINMIVGTQREVQRSYQKREGT